MEDTFWEIMEQVFDEEKINLEDKLEDLDWDSLTKISLISEIEEEFDIMMSQKNIQSFIYVKDILNFIKKCFK